MPGPRFNTLQSVFLVLGCVSACVKAPPATTVQISAPTVESTMIAATADVLIDPAFDTAARATLIETASQAQAIVVAAFGGREGPVPLTIFCKSEESACALAYAGTGRTSKSLAVGQPATGASWVPTRKGVVVLVEPKTDVLSFTVHEQTHVEFFHRLKGAPVPHWFAEGVAVSISRQACRDVAPGIDDLTRLTDPEAWSAYARQAGVGEPVYCQAGAEVSAWLARAHASNDEASNPLASLVSALSRGQAFAQTYGPLVNPSALSQVVVTPTWSVGDSQTPFTVALRVRPASNVGVLATLSSTPIGTGSCTTLLGFDASNRLVAQIFGGGGPEPKFFFPAWGTSMPTGRWSHVAMTWAPKGKVRLFVDGKEVAATDAPHFVRHLRAGVAYVTWGSFGLAGSQFCRNGHTVARRFDGQVTDLQLFPRALSHDELAALAAQP